MKIYLVGGAVRDQLLRRKIKERDWVVVGATLKEMLSRGFKQVGRDFPVFLHPKTHEEYALARTERKTGKGYTQFQCFFDPTVTLEEDLKRRDLTINAMARTLNGKLVDPYNGAKDLKQKTLRHVSEAFAEDPVRILRVARFAARFGDFKIHPKTNALMRQMLKQGEVDALVPERVWQELERALKEPHPERFFMVLKNCGVLSKLFPEISAHFSSSIKALKKSVISTTDSSIRFAALLHNTNLNTLQKFCVRYRVPGKYQDLALIIAKYQTQFKHATQLGAPQLLNLLTSLDVFRRPERFLQFLCAAETIVANSAKQTRHLLKAYKQAAKITGKMLIAKGTPITEIPAALHQARLKAIMLLKSS